MLLYVSLENTGIIVRYYIAFVLNECFESFYKVLTK